MVKMKSNFRKTKFLVFVKDKSHEGFGDWCFIQWENGVNQGLHEAFFRKIRKGQGRNAQTYMLSSGWNDFRHHKKDISRAKKFEWNLKEERYIERNKQTHDL